MLCLTKDGCSLRVVTNDDETFYGTLSYYEEKGKDFSGCNAILIFNLSDVKTIEVFVKDETEQQRSNSKAE